MRSKLFTSLGGAFLVGIIVLFAVFLFGGVEGGHHAPEMDPVLMR